MARSKVNYNPSGQAKKRESRRSLPGLGVSQRVVCKRGFGRCTFISEVTSAACNLTLKKGKSTWRMYFHPENGRKGAFVKTTLLQNRRVARWAPSGTPRKGQGEVGALRHGLRGRATTSSVKNAESGKEFLFQKARDFLVEPPNPFGRKR